MGVETLKQNECSYCNVFLKFEPIVLHVFCANLNSAKVLFTCALEAGLRNSGIMIGKYEKLTLAIRSSHMMEAPLVADYKVLTSEEYIQALLQEANRRMEENFLRINRFHHAICERLVQSRLHDEVKMKKPEFLLKKKKDEKKHGSDVPDTAEDKDLTADMVEKYALLGESASEKRKSVTQLNVASPIDCLLALSEGQLFVLDASDLQILGGGSRLKNLQFFCVNENPQTPDPQTIQLCGVKKKNLKVWNLGERRMLSQVGDVSLPQPPRSMAMAGSYVCLALTDEYRIFNWETGASQELFPFQEDFLHPLVTWIRRDEFMVSAPGPLGVFASVAGVSETPPIRLPEEPLAAAHREPYLLVLHSNVIAVFSLLDQKKKQQLPFAMGRGLAHLDGRLYAWSPTAVSYLRPFPINTQIQGLLANGHVEEALEMASNLGQSGMAEDEFQLMFRCIQQEGGFVEFARENFPQAKELFLMSGLDVREEVDTGLVKLLAELSPDKLVDFIQAETLKCDAEESLEWLSLYKRHHARAHLLQRLNRHSEALAIWSDLCDGQLFDPSFQGIGFLEKYIIMCHDRDIVWKYADFVFGRDPDFPVTMLIGRDPEEWPPSIIITYLSKYPQAQLKYLEHLVLEDKSEREDYHTQLALNYLSQIEKGNMERKEKEVETGRMKLRKLIALSSQFKAQLLLGRTKELGLLEEMALLYGKLGEHKKALDILVHELGDTDAARDYCLTCSDKADTDERTTRAHLLLILLQTYLNPSLDQESQMQLRGPALDLLVKHATDFNVTDVLAILPDSWRLDSVHTFLIKSIREALHSKRMLQVKRNLSQELDLHESFVHLCLTRESIIMNSSREKNLKMSDYHKPEAKSLQELRDIAHKFRIHSIQSTTAGKSGHPTSCCSMAEIMSVLFFNTMRYKVKEPRDPSSDRFILSKGHAAPILYAAWAEAGLFPTSDLLNLRKFESDLEGHPTPRLNFVDVATGSLGQGLSVAAGMAYVGKHFDKASYRVYCLIGDGESAEGSVWEALNFASHYHLDNLVAIFDVNRLGQSDPTILQHDMDVYKNRLESFGFHTLVVDGHNIEALCKAFYEASNVQGKPSAILAKTYKGKGIPNVEDKENWHGKPLGDESASAIQAIESLIANKGASTLVPKTPLKEDAAHLHNEKVQLSEPPSYEKGQLVATRLAYGTALLKLARSSPHIIALDGDTKNSTYSDKIKKEFPDRHIECYIAEQNLVGVALGAACRGRTIPFVSTFAAFFTRAFDQLRMGAISQGNIVCVGSHAGVSIGEDGPSQMALEDLAMFRSIPSATVFYPSDGVSTERAVELAANTKGIVFIRTSRPTLPNIYPNDEEFQIGKAKVVRESTSDQVLVIGACVTLAEALKAAEKLSSSGINIRVMDPFTLKPIDKDGIIKHAKECGGRIITVEDHYPEGGLGEAVMSAVALERDILVWKLAVPRIPRSGPPAVLLEHFGISADAIENAQFLHATNATDETQELLLPLFHFYLQLLSHILGENKLNGWVCLDLAITVPNGMSLVGIFPGDVLHFLDPSQGCKGHLVLRPSRKVKPEKKSNVVEETCLFHKKEIHMTITKGKQERLVLDIQTTFGIA
ncbi:unnamed protein product [Darwinula stevensoni]|uniref:Transketolase n=1 Tax=Darwinula stevensoni TaxID=69355 RepID=A0A7R9A0X2_9CRUS|nr:unnamed protein product [Darwinula stevensoni]CAG0882189.1 unnamed protein product [Darwinula stevensoni]